jgi:seryl-tRNA synthetase
MIDMKLLRKDPRRYVEAARVKREKVDVQSVVELDAKSRQLRAEVEQLRHKRKTLSQEIGELKRAGRNPPGSAVEEVQSVGAELKRLEHELREVDGELEAAVQWIPNVPHETVPVGGEDANQEVRRWGRDPTFDFEPLPHWELGESLGILDFPRAAKLSGGHFCVFAGFGARLQRALLNFMIELHATEHGYREVWPPTLANRTSMLTTGQLPKLEDDMYHLPRDDYFLVPTGEVPLTNMHRGEVLDMSQLPLSLVAYTPCFRREAGSYGAQTRGLNRVHQFDKVELVRFAAPENSYDELERMVGEVEKVLQLLNLPYRVIVLATGELSFAAAKCYDLEVWSAGQKRYLEVSSCSNFEDFQARRGNIRFRRAAGSKPEFVHTLNGSGVAFARTVAAILEQYQTEDGRVTVPEVLVPYMGGVTSLG